MNCRKIRKYLFAFADGQLGVKANCEMLDHLKMCRKCSAIVDEHQAVRRARTVSVGSCNVRFASPEDLIVHKMVAGRARDLEDVRSVWAKNQDLDFAYIRRWLTDLSTALERPLLEEFTSVVGGTP